MKSTRGKWVIRSFTKIMIWSNLAIAANAMAQVIGPVIDVSTAVIAGAGCDSQSTGLASMRDQYGNAVVVISYDRLKAEIQRPVSAQRSNCSIRLKTNIPAGRKLRLISVLAYGDSDSYGPVSAAAVIKLSLHSKSVAILQRNLSSYYDDAFFELSKNFARGDAEVPRSSSIQRGLIGIDAVTSIQSSIGEGQVNISSIALTYKVE